MNGFRRLDNFRFFFFLFLSWVKFLSDARIPLYIPFFLLCLFVQGKKWFSIYCFLRLIIKRKFFDPKFKWEDTWQRISFLNVSTEKIYIYGINRISRRRYSWNIFSGEDSFGLRISVKRQILHAFLHRRVKVTTRCSSDDYAGLACKTIIGARVAGKDSDLQSLEEGALVIGAKITNEAVWLPRQDR